MTALRLILYAVLALELLLIATLAAAAPSGGRGFWYDCCAGAGAVTPFHRALQHTLDSEGYYADSGPTYRNIDRRYWPEWPGWAVVDDWLAGNITVPVRDAALVGPVE